MKFSKWLEQRALAEAANPLSTLVYKLLKKKPPADFLNSQQISNYFGLTPDELQTTLKHNVYYDNGGVFNFNPAGFEILKKEADKLVDFNRAPMSRPGGQDPKYGGMFGKY